MSVIDSIRLDFPATWRQVPTERVELDEFLRASQATEEWQRMAIADRRMVELFLQRFLVDVQASGVQWAAIFSDASVAVLDAAGPDSGAEATVATAVLSTLTAADMGTSLPLTPHVLQAAMSLTKEISPLAATRITNLDVPQIVDLSCSKAVRVRRLSEQYNGTTKSLASYSDAFFISLPESTDRVVVLQFATPHLGDVEVFSEYFAGLADAVTFYREGEATVL